MKVFSIESLDEMLALLKDHRLEAAQVPSAVNLSERLDALGLRHRGRLGWSSIRLDLSGIGSRRIRLGAAVSIDRRLIQEGLVRSGGRISNTLDPSPGPGGASGPFNTLTRGSAHGAHISLAVPAGDEQLGQIARIVQQDVANAGGHVALLTAEPESVYGPWRTHGPAQATLLRVSGGPGLGSSLPGPRSMNALPMFQVADYLAWRPRVGGMRVNPTVAGPLYEASHLFIRRRHR
jgi:hypothetical protein